MSASGIFPTDEWTVAQGNTPAGPIIMRYRTGDPSPADRELFNKFIIVRWAFESGETPGMPSPEDHQSMVEFEEPVMDASDEAETWGSCVSIVTHNETREWRFYTPDQETFMREFNEVLKGLGPYPLDLQVFDDPDWTGFAEIRESTA